MLAGEVKHSVFSLRIYPQEAMPLGARCLRLGCKGRDVLALQRELAAAGYPLETDGRYGYATEETVRALQGHFGLTRDGVAGPDTISALRAAREGTGFLVHRARLGEDDAAAAKALDVTVESLRRHNKLRRRDKITAGRLLSVPTRLLFLGPGEPHAPSLKCTAVLGPILTFNGEGLAGGETVSSGDMPWLTADAATWHRLLRQRCTWPELFDLLRRQRRDQGWSQWLLELPSHLWWRRRHLLSLLAAMARKTGQAPLPVVQWPGRTDPPPDLAALRRVSGYILLDPGAFIYRQSSLARLLRQISGSHDPHCLIPVLRAGGLIKAANGVNTVLPVRDARVAAVSARLKLVWDEVEKVYRGTRPGGKHPWEVYLLEERGLRERVRLADRFACAGLTIGGLAGVALPPAGIWPGEFAVLDSFPPPRHID